MKIIFTICLTIIFGSNGRTSTNVPYGVLGFLGTLGLIGISVLIYCYIRYIRDGRIQRHVPSTDREMLRSDDATSSGIDRTIDISDDIESNPDLIPYKTVTVNL